MLQSAVAESVGRHTVRIILSPVTFSYSFFRWMWNWCKKPKPPQVDWEGERQLREERERQKKLNADRRDELRLACELAYRRHAEKFSDSLPPEQFYALLTAYLSSVDEPETAERRTRMIMDMFADRVSESEPEDEGQFESLQELAERFADTRRQVEELPYDEETIGTFQAIVNEQETKAMERFLEKGMP